ncbi:MAG: hypothetical protein IT204_19955 [Fimbriimonadaceae bacterium]|nr:hypothetical protein [Fimbriimonadaceae bacterium]
MNRLIVNADLGSVQVSRHLYGHFAEHLGRCIYDGLWVGEQAGLPQTRGFRDDVVAALRRLRMPNLRWPGGCFADTYHWRDGIGPRAERPSIVNVHWGGVTENNHCGTHEFMDLCEQLSGPGWNCEPYLCGNVGSGSVREMAEWLEYLTMPGESPMAALRRANGREQPWPITWWAVGNENWGCGGQMRAEYYADEFRRYACFCRHFSGGKLYKVACGHDDAWNEVLLQRAVRQMDGLSIHYYTVPGPWHQKGPATGFSERDWAHTLRRAAEVDGFLRRTAGLLDRHDPSGRVGIVLDEWGTWYDVEPGTNPGFLYQQNTLRDALVAALSLHIFHRHAPRLQMANIAQTVNVLQAMVLTEGPRLLTTPTGHVFEMLNVHHDATRLVSDLTCTDYTVDGITQPRVSAAATRDDQGRVHLSLANLHHAEVSDLRIEVRGMLVNKAVGRVLSGPAPDSHNTFDAPETVAPQPLESYRRAGDGVAVELPPRSVVVLELT